MLSVLTGDKRFADAAYAATERLHRSRTPLGLLGKHIQVHDAAWTEAVAGVGYNADSFYEYLLRAIMIPKWLFLPAVFRPLRTVFRGLGAGFLNLGEKTEGTAKERGKNEQKWARNGLRRVGVGGNHYCAE